MANRAMLTQARIAASAKSILVQSESKWFTFSNGFLGSKGWELKFPNFQNITRNPSAIINGRSYSGHALDQMQNRGLMPSVVENAIQFGKISPDPIMGRQRYFDPVNKITVIIEEGTGKIVTAIPGKRNL